MRVSANVTIRGTKPMLFCAFPIDALDEGKPKTGLKAKDHEEWKRTVRMTSDRQLYVVSIALVCSIKAAGKMIKVGKSNMMKKVESCLEILEDVIPVKNRYVPEENQLTQNTTEPVYLDVRSVVNPMTKGRNLRYRIATAAGWEVSFTVQWDDCILSKDTMKTCIQNAGLYEGLGDARRLGFGKYEVINFSSNN